MRNGANINEKDVKIFQSEKQIFLKGREREREREEKREGLKAERRRKGAGTVRRRKNFSLSSLPPSL